MKASWNRHVAPRLPGTRKEAQRLSPVDVLFLGATPGHRVWVESIQEALPEGIASTYLARNQASGRTAVVRALRPRIIVTPDSGAYRGDLSPGAITVHVPHSLVSLHGTYGDGAFQDMDRLFSCGPHHDAEWAALQPEAARANPVGYPRGDALSRMYAGTEPDPERVAIVASWGPGNCLDAHGEALVRRLRDDGKSVVVRPHPRHILDGSETLAAIRSMSERDPGIIMDLEPDGQHTRNASVFVSDYSGAAYEAAFFGRRAVVFVDAPRKVSNSRVDQIGLPLMEEDARERVGTLVADALPDIIDGVDRAKPPPHGAERGYLHRTTGAGPAAAGALDVMLQEME